jgi:putative nucleotidyltransferase with HDIG domain
MGLRDDIRDAFPELDDFDDPELAEGVERAWEIGLEEAGEPDLASYPWFAPYQEQLGLGDELLAPHTREVTAAALSLAESLVETRRMDIDLDLIRAGALVHDVSHLREFDGTEWAPAGVLLGHPYHGQYVARRAGLPVEVEHMVLSHTVLTNVEPAFIEAELLRDADLAIANAVRSRSIDDLRNAPVPEPY